MSAPPRAEQDALLCRIAPDVKLGRDVRIYAFVNLYGCEIGDGTSIGTFVEIQKGVRIGARCKIQSHTFICEGVTIEDEVFVGHNVNFINDRFPRAANPDGSRQTEADWHLLPTVVQRGASIGTAGRHHHRCRRAGGRRFGGNQGRARPRGGRGESRPGDP
jgi:acetyltransferase-like isoleucine patch superfamily enzyme